MARSARKTRTVSVDFEGVDRSGGGSFHIPEGDYQMEVIEVEQGTSKNDNEQFEWKFKGLEGKAKGKTFYYYTTLTPESLWKLANALEALGFEVPEEAMDIDLDELIGLECMGVVVDDEYQGKTKSKLSEIYASDSSDKKPDSSSKSASRRKNGPDKIAESEVKSMSEDELQELVDKHDLDVKLRTHKTLRRKADAVITALEEGNLLES